MRFWTEEFFSAVAVSLNEDQKVGEKLSGIATSIVADCTDREPSFIISVNDGKIKVQGSKFGTTAEFVFSAPYDEWVRIVRDILDIRGEILKGRVKFKGSMPKMLLYLGRVSKMEKEIIGRMRAMEPEY